MEHSIDFSFHLTNDRVFYLLLLVVPSSVCVCVSVSVGLQYPINSSVDCSILPEWNKLIRTWGIENWMRGKTVSLWYMLDAYQRKMVMTIN